MTADRTTDNSGDDVHEERDVSCVTAEVLTSVGRAIQVEFNIQAEIVEISHRGTLYGVLDRVELRDWLSKPAVSRGSLAGNDVKVAVDRMIDRHGRIAITLPRAAVHGWALSPSEIFALTTKV